MLDDEEGWWSEPPEQQARRIVDDLSPRFGAWWSGAGISDGRWGAAPVCRLRPARVVHVVGASEMAAQLREIFGGGAVAGWTLHPMPPTLTPLHDFLDALVATGPQPGSMRGYNLLDRHGFVYAEEVQHCPDEALLDIRNFGRIALAAVRDILGPAPAPAIPSARIDLGRRSADENVPARQQHLDDNLAAPAAARYRDFARLLAQSQIPLAALDKICAALNGEPVPPADPLVTLLLDTAGEPDLLTLYRATHRESETNP